MPARYLHRDEIDEYPDNVDDQGDPLALSEARTDTYGLMKKILDTSTPTVKDRSKIERQFLNSDQRYFWLACPHCEERQVLKWESMKWTDDDATTARYVCEHCGAEIEEHQKTQMLAGGQWIPANPGHQARGYSISSLYSPLGWKSWSDIVREYLTAQSEKQKGNIEPMISFTNNRLAQTWEEKGEEVDGDRLRRRAEDFRLRLVPFGGLVLTGAIDTQDDRLELMIVAWGRGEECWVVDYTAFYGDPGEPDVWQKADDFLKQPVRHESGTILKVDAVAVDTGGHFTHEAYAFCRERVRRNYYACKGINGEDRPVKGRWGSVDIKRDGKVIPNGVKLWLVGQHVGKNLLANRLKLNTPGPGYIHLSTDLANGNFFDQMTAEHRVWVGTSTGKQQRWVKKAHSARNEAWDLLVLNLFAAHSLDIHRYVEGMWDRLEEIVQPVRLILEEPQRPVSSQVGKIDLARSGRFGNVYQR
jgi:phage terminase large subunit GpA-like protein